MTMKIIFFLFESTCNFFSLLVLILVYTGMVQTKSDVAQ